MAKKKYQMRVTQTIVNVFEVEADDNQDTFSMAIDMFNNEKNCDIDTQACDITPRFLEEPPDDGASPLFMTHFDCWGPKGGGHDAPEDLWPWDSRKAVAMVNRLAAQWDRVLRQRRYHKKYKFNFKQFARTSYKKLGQIAYFHECGKKFIEMGFCVLDNDTCFEVYEP